MTHKNLNLDGAGRRLYSKWTRRTKLRSRRSIRIAMMLTLVKSKKNVLKIILRNIEIKRNTKTFKINEV